jgi:hypothetical protein
VLEPRLAAIRWPAVLLAAAGVFVRRGNVPWLARFLLALTIAFAVAAGVRPGFGADSISYYSYLRSIAFDRDLDFTNEWRAWGYEPHPLTPTGLRANVFSIGPALLWSPFFLLGHALVLLEDALGFGRYAADGWSAPYLRAASLGTLTALVAGSLLLFRLLSREHGPAVATLAVAGTIATSPVGYYAFKAPAMAHAAAFGAVCACVWACEQARERSSLRAWILVGVSLGASCLMRWQALVLVIPIAWAALGGLRRQSLPAGRLLAAGAAAFLVFSPQLLAWKALFGRYLTVPQGRTFLDWTSPHFVDVLLSANHGLFTWSPAMLLGAAGLVLGLPRAPRLHAAGLAVLFATAWVNGSARDWDGSDAFGARRFDVALPLLAVGLASFTAAAARWARRQPLLAPAGLLAALALWNLGLAAHHAAGRYPEAAPLDRLAGDQARLLREVVQDALGMVAGPAGRGFAYKVMSGEYVYTSNPAGTLNLALLDDRELSGGWSGRQRPRDGPGFRWALGDSSCIRVALEAPFDLTAVVKARAPQRLEPQLMTLAWNGHHVDAALLSHEWSDHAFSVPVRLQYAGENQVCFSFSQRPENEDVRAAVALIQLP